MLRIFSYTFCVGLARAALGSKGGERVEEEVEREGEALSWAAGVEEEGVGVEGGGGEVAEEGGGGEAALCSGLNSFISEWRTLYSEASFRTDFTWVTSSVARRMVSSLSGVLK